MKLKEDFTARSRLRDIGRWHVTQFVKEVSALLPAGSSLLDAGAGECAYKQWFAQQRYTAIDAAIGEMAWNYSNLAIMGALDKLSFAGGSFDAVLCTQTLEHLQTPAENVAEMGRVLKPGGRLFLTAPFAHPEHQAPYDYFRYTSFALKMICLRAGFSDVLLEPFGGTFTRMAYELPSVLSVFPAAGRKIRPWKLRGVLCLPLKAVLLVAIRVTQLILLALDRFDTARIYPFGWRVIARKC
jgi:SAM-dependent methyltransferase